MLRIGSRKISGVLEEDHFSLQEKQVVQFHIGPDMKSLLGKESSS
jgi:hypothetical protein